MSYVNNLTLWLQDVKAAQRKPANDGPGPRERLFLDSSGFAGSLSESPGPLQRAKALGVDETEKILRRLHRTYSFVGDDIPQGCDPDPSTPAQNTDWKLFGQGLYGPMVRTQLYCKLEDWIARERSNNMRCFATAHFYRQDAYTSSPFQYFRFTFVNAIAEQARFHVRIPILFDHYHWRAQRIADHPDVIWEVVQTPHSIQLACGALTHTLLPPVCDQLRVPPQAVAATMPEATLHTAEEGQYLLSSAVTGQRYRLVPIWGRLVVVLDSQHPTAGFTNSVETGWVELHPDAAVRVAR